MVDVLARVLEASALGAILEALPGPVVAVSDDIRVAASNGPARDILTSLRIGEPLALTLRDPDVLDAARRVLLGGEREIVIWRDRVPVERAFEVTVARLNLASAAPMLLLSLRDRTEARRLERMRADFIANASHELRTPLASILGFVETLQGPAREDSSARERFLTIMAEQARRMARLVDDLLSLSRIEQTLHLRPSKAVDLDAIVRHVADTLAPLADEKHVTLAIRSPGPVMVAGEWDELVRIAENLIENAIKYGCSEKLPRADGPPAATRVDIELSRSGRDGLFSVRDQGPGIAAHHLPRLTERFYRVDASHSRAQGGTGLGLALVKHIVARHRGRMTIDSVPGEGATFKAALPLHACDAPAP